MITYSQIPAEGGVAVSRTFVEPIIVVGPQRPPDGATIHAAKGVASPTGGYDVEYDRECAKPGDWLEITLPDQPLLPAFTATPWSMTDDERQRTAFHLVNLSVILNARADDFEKFVSTAGHAPEERAKAKDAYALAKKIMP